jgi:autophagy-related protein 27
MVIAAYVIYSAFLNYSRYGAGSGWDLLPHSDTLRDMFVLYKTSLTCSPYLIRDFTTHVVSTVKGGGSRGGYSAI